MKVYCFLTLFLFSLFFVNSSFGDQGDSRAGCTKDSECVLYKNGCRELLSILKSKLPEGSESYYKGRATIYIDGPNAPRGCTRTFVTDPIWPENPVPKCINNVCEVISEKKSSKAK